MQEKISEFFDADFALHQPKSWSTPLILSAPHGGRGLPQVLLENSSLSVEKLLATSDFHTDQLAQADETLASIVARNARVFVDLNRDPNLLDPAVIKGAPRISNPYIEAGYGVIPRFAARGALIHQRKWSKEEAETRLERFHLTFHHKLRELLDFTRSEYGYALLLDVHSAPDNALKGADIVIGTHFGASIDADMLGRIKPIFLQHFAEVQIDKPFSGGYVTQYHASPDQGIHILQLEINRNLIETEGRGFRQDFLKKWRVVLNAVIEALREEPTQLLAAQ